ncbi:MAG: prolyl oligopeptidase family serine peptidase [Rhodobacteraceae bacterium]|nr:prolyl oligopeptidase family serine peptidase [Paracoccaceae bacterium]
MGGLTLEPFGEAGALYGPETGTDIPAIVILHGSEGAGSGWAHRFAAILAAHGMLALPLPYGEGDVWGAGPIRDVSLRAVPAAGRALASHSRAGRVGLLGWSKGGEMALLAAALSGKDTPFACVAAHAPPAIVTPAFDPEAFRAGRWGRDMGPESPRAWLWPGEEDALVPGTPLPVERIAVPVFLSIGLADSVVAPEGVQAMAARLSELGRAPDLMCAEGQDHAFDWATEPLFWSRLIAFLRRHLED